MARVLGPRRLQPLVLGAVHAIACTLLDVAVGCTPPMVGGELVMGGESCLLDVVSCWLCLALMVVVVVVVVLGARALRPALEWPAFSVVSDF